MKTYYKHNPSRRFVIARSETTWQSLVRLPRFLWSLAMTVLLTLIRTITSALWRALTLPMKLLPHRLIRKLNSTQRLFLNVVIAATILIFGIFIYTSFINPEQTKAAWWDTGWQYRQAVTATNSSPYQATNIPYRILIDTSTLISSGKMKSDGSDIRVVNNKGKIVRFQIEQSTLNTTQTGIWFDATIEANNSAVYYVYYGNSQAQTPTFSSDIASNTGSGTTVTTKDGFEYTTSTSYGRISDIKKDGTNLGVDGAYRQTPGAYPGDWWDDRAFTRTQLASGPMFVEVKFEDTNYGSYSSFGTIVKMFRNGFAENQIFLNYNTSGSGYVYYYQWFDSDTRNSLWVNSSGALVDQAADSGVLSRSDLKDNWFGQRWTGSGNYGGTIISPIASDWNSGQTSAQNSYYQTNYSTTESYTNGSSRKVRFGIFAGTGTSAQMHEKGSLLGAQSTALSSEESTPGPVAYWKFDEGSGTTAHDSAGNNNGTISGATWASKDQCISDKCLQFDGTDDGIDTGHDLSWANTDPYTFSLWVRPTTTTADHAILGKTSYEYTLMQDDDHFGFTYWSSGGGGITYLYSNTVITAGRWYFINIVSDGSVAKMYINGKLDDTDSSISGTNQNRSESLKIGYGYTNNGSGAGTHYFPGKIDDVKIYSYARSADQILSDYNKGSANVLGASDQSTLSNGLVGYWKMDEASWNGTSGEVKDASGNGNNGTSASGAEASPSAKFGNAGYFAGNDEYVDVTDSSTLNPGTGDITIAAWVYNNGTKNAPGVLSKNGSPGYRLVLDWSELRFGIYDGSSWHDYESSGANRQNNTWQYIVVSINRSKGITFYINGNKLNTVSTVDTKDVNITNIGDLIFGDDTWCRGPDCGQLPGNLDEIRIYNRALSPAEVTQLYHYAPGPVAYYNFEEASGSTAYDRSENGNDGTLNNGPKYRSGKYGSAVWLDGSNQYIDLGNTSSQVNYTGAVTVGAWVNLTRLTGINTIASLGFDYGGHKGLWFFYDSSTEELGYEIGDGNGITFKHAKTPEINKWIYVSFVYQAGGTSYIYYDGSAVGSFTNSPQVVYQSTHNALGRDYLRSYYWQGGLDEIRVYNYARTPGQIVEDMNAGHPIGGSPIGSQVGYWKFDEGYGTTAHNSGNAGSALDGTINGGATWTDGKFGKALSFDGSNDTVTIPAGDNSALDGENGFTYSVWMKRTEASVSQWPIVIGAGDTHTYYGIRSLSYGDTISLEYGQTPFDGSSYNNISCGSNSLPLNQWHHFTATYDGSRISIYRDTKLCGSGLKVLNSTYPSTFYINTGGFKGLIDEVKVYNAALTADQVKLDYNSGQSLRLGSIGTDASGNPSNTADRAYCPPGDTTATCGPVAEWDFEEGSGTTIYDKSGNGNNGTLTNNPTWTQGKIGKALHFNNSNYALVSPMTGLPTAQITVAAWVKVDLHQNWHNFVNHEWIGNGWLLFSNSSGVPYFGVGQSNIQYSAAGANISTNPWNYLVGTYDGSNVTIYVNGVKGGTVALAGATLDNAGDIYIGSNVKGSIDQVRIYNYALSPAQVAWNYNRGAPVAHYKLDECQGSAVHSSADSYDPLLNGTITIGSGGTQTSVGTCQTSGTAWGNGASGRYGGSLSFDGTDDYFEISQPNIPTSPNSFTVSGWIKPGAQDGFIITPNSNGIDQRIGYDTDSQRLHVSIATAGDTNNAEVNSTTNSVPNTGVWTYFAVSINNRDVKIYINGKLNSSLTHGYDIGGWTGNWRIGQRGNSTYWYKGQMDDLQIFNYVLTSQQVKSLYNNSSAIYFGP